MTIYTGIGIYLLIGGIALVIFDAITKRIRHKMTSAVVDTQNRLVASGNPVGNRVAAVLLFWATWLFWPVVFIGAITKPKGGHNGKSQ